MSKVKVAAFSVSLDGFGAGTDQSRENPLGKRGEELHEWIIPTKMFQKMMGKEGGTEGQCGWLKDKYGMSWQIVPAILIKLLQDKDAEKSKRVMQAMLQMKKIDIEGLKKA